MNELINRKGVVLHQGDLRPNTGLVIRQKLSNVDWDILLHPLYSPALARSDY